MRPSAAPINHPSRPPPQAQALLAEKQQLAQAAAALEAQKQQLEERLTWLEVRAGLLAGCV